MSERQRSKTEELFEKNASLIELLSEPDIINQSKWETVRSLQN
jgi:hypothetical protein